MRTESTAPYEGILNRSQVKGSPPSQVTSYYLSEEERKKLIEKYGPILPKKTHRKMFNPKN